MIARRFDENRQIPEPRVRKMLEDVLSSPLAPRVARLIEKRLGRKLEPFDIWYSGFKPRGAYTEAQLDEIVRKKYPTAEDYKKDIPNLLEKLGFSKEKAQWVAANIVVDPARGSGHAMGAARRGDQAHLRTRVEKGGMNYKGFNIAVHEMGHNVEQTFSLNAIDHTLLSGVPNTAFTEALAFVFQARDLELLGLSKPDPQSRALKTVNEFWGTFEISGVALVDMGVWHWMYDHPDATPAQLKEATLQIARDVWNKYFAPIFGTAGRHAARDLLPHDQLVSLPPRLPDRPHDRVPDRPADGKGRVDRPGVRADGEDGQRHARRLDDARDGRARRPAGPPGRDGKGARRAPGEVEVPGLASFLREGRGAALAPVKDGLTWSSWKTSQLYGHPNHLSRLKSF